eukprot:14986761-Alexandrium_andersonii.AAC.1
MAAVLPLCAVDLDRPWSDLVACSDASLSGRAVARSSWGLGTRSTLDRPRSGCASVREIRARPLAR